MKSLTLIALFLISSLISCSSSNDDNPTNPTEIPTLNNKWFLDKWSNNSINQTLTSCDKQGYIQFNSNGTFERKDYYWNGTTCTIEGNDVGNYTYNYSSAKITLTFNDIDDGPQTEVLNNIQITTTTLKYTWDEDGNGTDEHQLEFKK